MAKEKAKEKAAKNPAFVPVTKQPLPCQLQDWMNLTELAYVLGKALGHPITVMQVVGALRSLGCKTDTRKYAAMSRGCMILRQQTMVHHTILKQLQKYFVEEKGYG